MWDFSPVSEKENHSMLFLGIDQHARQLTVSLRDQNGDVLLVRQVSTQPDKILDFFDQLTRCCAQRAEPFIAVVEVCGFNDWLIRMLQDYRCHKVILVQPEERKRCKTDRRDAAALSELLWVNRDRFLAGWPVRGLRQVEIPCSTDQQDRKLTTLRKEAGQAQTQLVNRVKYILRTHNLQWELPTKTFPTARAVAWLRTLALPEIDRLEMSFLLEDLAKVQLRLGQLEKLIAERGRDNRSAQLLTA
jgi:transposase